jgi:molybdopterin-guanine dinucleotide biosynthesis protein A
MKTIVVSGASRGVGKSTLANKISALLNNATVIKIGSHKNISDGKYFNNETKWETIESQFSSFSYLIIESNSIHTEIKPDLSIFLDGEDRKPSSAIAISKADIISGHKITPKLVNKIAFKLEINVALAKKIALLSGARLESLTGVILAGGKSSRMGQDKALLHIGNESMVQRIYNVLKKNMDEVIIIGAYESRNCYVENVPFFTDEKADKGPLMGIITALHNSKNEVNFIISCDTPEFHPQLVSDLLANLENNEIAAPIFNSNRPEPLCTIYRKSVLSKCETLLRNDILRPSALFAECLTSIVKTGGDWFSNLNTPEEYQQYLVRKGL